MVTQIHLGDMAVDVVQKSIKNIHLSVYPPQGKVRIAAPLRMDLDTIRVFAISKLGWIKQQQEKLRGQARQAPREYLDRESHYVWGKRYLLKVVEQNAPPHVALKHSASVYRPQDEDEMGQLHTNRQTHPYQSGANEEAPRMPGVHRGPRIDSPAGAHPQQSLHRIDDAVHAEVAFLQG